MRVIAGSARRILLNTPEGLDTRPTTDRIKETLFNILQPEVPGSRFLDLFAGSGGIGIEALSRGARSAVFVDNSRKAVSCIQENLNRTHFSEEGKIMTTDAVSAVRRLDTQGTAFDIIFMDPPYNKGLEFEVLKALANSHIIHEDTMVIIEVPKHLEFEPADLHGFAVSRIKEYKTNKHVFLSTGSDMVFDTETDM